MKFLIKLVLAALIAYGTWQIGSAYAANYRFKDATEQAALLAKITDAELRARVMELASENDVPLEAEDLSIRRESSHIFVDVSYVRDVSVLPWYSRQWPFSWSVDVFVVTGTGMVPKR